MQARIIKLLLTIETIFKEYVFFFENGGSRMADWKKLSKSNIVETKRSKMFDDNFSYILLTLDNVHI